MEGMECFTATGAIVLFDAAGNVTAFTDEAQHLLWSGDTVELRGTRLHARDGKDDIRLQHLIEACTCGIVDRNASAASRHIALNGRATHLSLYFSALRERVGTGAVDGQAPSALAVLNASADFGFTAAESAVADSLWRGAPLRTIAKQRGTSLETVRTQAKAIYAKLGVQNRTQMLAKLSGHDLCRSGRGPATG